MRAYLGPQIGAPRINGFAMCLRMILNELAPATSWLVVDATWSSANNRYVVRYRKRNVITGVYDLHFVIYDPPPG